MIVMQQTVALWDVLKTIMPYRIVFPLLHNLANFVFSESGIFSIIFMQTMALHVTVLKSIVPRFAYILWKNCLTLERNKIDETVK